MPQFIVHSTHALFWPTLEFRIRKGENRYPSKSAIPDAVFAKLDYLSKPKKTRDGQRIPAAVRFYEAEATGAASDPDEEVEITEAGLAKLNMKDLQTLADKLGVDHKGLTAKQQLRDKILAEASGTASDPDEDDSEEDLDDDEDESA